MAVSLSANTVGLTSEVTQHRAGLVLRWVTVHGSRYLIKRSRPTQPSHPPMGRRNEY